MTFALLGVALRMATGVDNGIYHGMGQRERSVYFYTMLALVLGGILGSVALVLSFGRGDPHRQFGFQPNYRGPGPGTLQQTELRGRLHDALVAAGFVLVAERNNPEAYGGWQRDYVRAGRLVRLTWNSETWYFMLQGGTPFRELAVKNPSDLSGKGLAEFIEFTNGADRLS